MSEARLQRARATLPEGYQFPTPSENVECDAFRLYRRAGYFCHCGARHASECAYGARPILRYDDDGQ